MHLNRLIFLSMVFIGLAATADAQYTNRSSYTARPTQGYAQPTKPTQGYAQPTRSTQGYAQPTKTTQGYAQPTRTTTGSAPQARTTTSYVNKPSQAQTAEPQAKPTFRPRQPVTADADDELPSFDSLEGQQANNGAANAEGGEAVPPPPPPKGQIWIYLTNFKDEGGHSRYCSWEIVVQNRTDADLKDLSIKYKLGNAFSDIAVESLAAGATAVDKNGIYNSKCPEMKVSKPTELNAISCKLGPVNGKDCNSYFVVK
ncbi:MAG: hypothetical protein J5716_03305 [Alphaproteobacteria bacterium]|nr:hypothetical protein [Alphaproteobacteria bacterium]